MNNPVSIDQDGVNYKRAVRLPNGLWAPMAECCCPSIECICRPPESRYGFGSSPNIAFDLYGGDGARISFSLNVTDLYTTVVAPDGTSTTAELLGQVDVLGEATNAGFGIDGFDLEANAYKGHCGFSTVEFGRAPHRDVAGPPDLGAWGSPTIYFGGNGFCESDRQWMTISRTPVQARVTTILQDGDSETVSGVCPVEIRYRIICDSVGLDVNRTSLASRSPVDYYENGSVDEYVPCLWVEYAYMMGPMVEDGTLEPISYRLSPLITNPCGSTINSAHEDYMVMIASGYSRLSFVSGESAAGFSMGDIPQQYLDYGYREMTNPSTGTPGPREIINHSPIQRTVELSEDDIILDTEKESGQPRMSRRFEAIDDSSGWVYESFRRFRDNRVGFRYARTIVDGQYDDYLVYNADWQPSPDPDNPVPNDLTVAVYRKCGTECDDIFIDRACKDSPARIRYAGSIYERTGINTIIETPNERFVPESQWEPTNDSCDGVPTYPTATSCDGSSTVTIDPLATPVDGVSFIAQATGVRYVLDGGESDLEPITDIVWSDEGCPPDDTIYRINRCGSTQQALGGVLVGDIPEGRAIGYRPGDGLPAGAGRVVYESFDGRLCLARLAGQPTTEVLDEEPDIVLTSQPGDCADFPVTVIDPRPQCQDQPGGGGGPGGTGSGRPSDPNDPAILAEIERQQQARTGQYPGRCPSCGG